MKLASMLVLVASLALLAGPVRASDPLRIPVIVSLTGPVSFYGQNEQTSLRLLEGLVNRSGGVRGRPIQLDFEDDQSNPQVAVQLASALIAKKVPLIFGPIFTPTCQAVAPLLEKDGPIGYCLSPAVFPKAGSYTFMAGPSIDDVQPVIFRYLKSRNWTKIAMITSTDASGADFERRVDGTLAAPEFAGLKTVVREHFATSDLSVVAQLERIKASHPDVLLTFTVGTPFGTLLRGIRDVGLDVPVYGSGGNFTYAQMQQYAGFLPKDLFLNGQRGIAPDPTSVGAVKRAQDLYFRTLASAGVRSIFATATPWDAMNLVVDAYRRAGADANAHALWSELQGLKNVAGIEGLYDFSRYPQRGIGEEAAALFRYDQAKNEFVQFYPTK